MRDFALAGSSFAASSFHSFIAQGTGPDSMQPSPKSSAAFHPLRAMASDTAARTRTPLTGGWWGAEQRGRAPSRPRARGGEARGGRGRHLDDDAVEVRQPLHEVVRVLLEGALHALVVGAGHEGDGADHRVGG